MSRLGAVLGAGCCHCRRPGPVVCATCSLAITYQPRTSFYSGISVLSGYRYQGVIRDLILTAKRTGNPDAIAFLIRLLTPVVAQAISDVGRSSVMSVAPIPSGSKTRFAVGADLPSLLMKGTLESLPDKSWRIESKLVAKPLRRSQKLRTKTQRDAVSFQSRDVVIGDRIVLIDDVMTTGSSMKAATHALRLAGAVPVYGLVIARA